MWRLDQCQTAFQCDSLYILLHEEEACSKARPAQRPLTLRHTALTCNSRGGVTGHTHGRHENLLLNTWLLIISWLEKHIITVSLFCKRPDSTCNWNASLNIVYYPMLMDSSRTALHQAGFQLLQYSRSRNTLTTSTHLGNNAKLWANSIFSQELHPFIHMTIKTWAKPALLLTWQLGRGQCLPFSLALVRTQAKPVLSLTLQLGHLLLSLTVLRLFYFHASNMTIFFPPN